MIDRTDRTAQAAARRYQIDPDDPNRWHDGVVSGLLLPRYIGRMLMEPMREAGLEPRAVLEVPCPHNGPIPELGHRRESCPSCKGTGTLPYDCMDLVRLYAYCGDPRARDLVPTDLCTVAAPEHVNGLPWHEGADKWPLGPWLTGLERLASKLPRTPETKGECGDCNGAGMRVIDHREFPTCSPCNGTGKTTHPGYPAEQYLLVAAAHAAAREVARDEWERPRPMCRDCADEDGMCPNSGMPCDSRPVYTALDACAAWLACPCPKHEEAWRRAFEAAACLWVPLLSRSKRAIQAATKILDPTRVRTVAAEAVLERA